MRMRLRLLRTSSLHATDDGVCNYIGRGILSFSFAIIKARLWFTRHMIRETLAQRESNNPVHAIYTRACRSNLQLVTLIKNRLPSLTSFISYLYSDPFMWPVASRLICHFSTSIWYFYIVEYLRILPRNRFEKSRVQFIKKIIYTDRKLIYVY